MTLPDAQKIAGNEKKVIDKHGRKSLLYGFNQERGDLKQIAPR